MPLLIPPYQILLKSTPLRRLSINMAAAGSGAVPEAVEAQGAALAPEAIELSVPCTELCADRANASLRAAIAGKIEDEFASSLRTFIREHAHQLPHVTQLDVLGVRLGRDGAAALGELFEKLAYLEVLVFGEHHLQGDSFRALVGRLGSLTSLRELTLSDGKRRQAVAQLGVAGASVLASVLPALGATLRSLTLWGCGLGDEGAAHIGRAIRSLPGLQRLCMVNSGLHGPGVAALAEALKSAECLQVLRLERQLAGDAGAHSLAHALPLLRHLVTLRLEECELGDAGAAALASVLAQPFDMPMLREVSLICNRFTAAGVAALRAADEERPGRRITARIALATTDEISVRPTGPTDG